MNETIESIQFWAEWVFIAFTMLFFLYLDKHSRGDRTVALVDMPLILGKMGQLQVRAALWIWLISGITVLFCRVATHYSLWLASVVVIICPIMPLLWICRRITKVCFEEDESKTDI